jgi:hypothetical protein
MSQTLREHELPETSVSEIEIAPDGRLFLFGASLPLLQFLEQAGLGDEPLHARLQCGLSSPTFGTTVVSPSTPPAAHSRVTAPEHD